jgi:hypothetical protein
MTLPQVQQLHDALGIAASIDLATITDQKLLDTIDAGNYGVQRICSQLMEVDDGVTTLPKRSACRPSRWWAGWVVRPEGRRAPHATDCLSQAHGAAAQDDSTSHRYGVAGGQVLQAPNRLRSASL